jgi:hypothetical protein
VSVHTVHIGNFVTTVIHFSYNQPWPLLPTDRYSARLCPTTSASAYRHPRQSTKGLLLQLALSNAGGREIVGNYVCVFITTGPITKLFAGGGGGEWRTCAMIDDEPRPVWMSPLITH